MVVVMVAVDFQAHMLVLELQTVVVVAVALVLHKQMQPLIHIQLLTHQTQMVAQAVLVSLL
jgi:hypothetical protein